MGRNSDGIGILLLLLLAGSVLGGGGPEGRPGSRLPLGRPDLGSLAREFHRMVGLMEKVDSLGQMAANPPRLPEPSQLINTNALPDMGAIMDVMGPLLGNFNSEK